MHTTRLESFLSIKEVVVLLIKMDVTKRPMYKYYSKLVGYWFIYVSYKLSIELGPVTSVGLPAVLGDHVIPVGLQRSLEERVTSVGLPAGFGGPCYTFGAGVPLRSALYLWGCQRAFEKSLTTKTRRKARIAMPKH